MYFKDLTKYKYMDTNENSFNVGWLDRRRSITKGEVPEEFVEKLWKYLRYPVNVCRGFHSCNLCSKSNTDIPMLEYQGEKRKAGYYEIRVFGKDGTIFAAPSLIFHYITCHHYQPPQSFVTAVLEGDEPDSQEYYRKVLECSQGDEFWLKEDRTICETTLDKVKQKWKKDKSSLK